MTNGHEPISPRSVLLTIGGGSVGAQLIAATEGVTRFVAGAAGETADEALERLSDRAGLRLTIDDVDAVIVHERPFQALVIGQPTPDDRSAMREAESHGALRTRRYATRPPWRASRSAGWARRARSAFDADGHDIAIVATPPGGSTWLPHIIDAFAERADPSSMPLLIVASDATPVKSLPVGMHLLVRDESLPQALADTLTAIRAGREVPERASATETPRARSSTHLAAIGMAGVRKAPTEAALYLDLACGATVATAHPTGVEFMYNAESDLSSAANMVQRVGAKEIAQWLPTPLTAIALRAWTERWDHPSVGGPADPEDRAIARACARAALRALMARSTVHQPISRCVVGSSLLELGTPVEVMALVADVLPSPGITDLFADRDDLLPAAGHLTEHAPAAAQSFIALDVLAPLGTIIVAPASGAKAAPLVALVPEQPAGSRMTIAANTAAHLVTPGATTVRLIRRDGTEESVTLGGGAAGTLVDTRARPVTRAATIVDSTRVSDRLRTSLAASAQP